MLFSVNSYSFDQLYVSLAYCSIQQNMKSSNYFLFQVVMMYQQDKQARQKCINKVIIRGAFSIESYFIRQLLVKNFCFYKRCFSKFFSRRAPSSRALKMVYFCQSSFERGSCFKTFQGSFPKLEFKSPTTMILLDLLYFLNCDHLKIVLVCN